MPQTLITEPEVQEALRLIVENAHVPALNYCVNYAKHGIDMSGHGLYVQVLYVLNNMSGWRGDTAKQVRSVLQAYKKQQEKK